MTEESSFRAPAIGGRSKRWGLWSISTLTRGLVLLGLALVAAISFSAIDSLRDQSVELDHLIMIIDPVKDSNFEIFREMTEAQSAMLRYQLTRNLRELVPYRDARVRILAALAPLHSQITALVKLESYSSGGSMADLENQQRNAIKLWLANSLKSERAVTNSESPNFTQNANLFKSFQQINSELNDLFEVEASRAQARARGVSDRGTRLVVVVSIAAAVLTWVLGLRLARSISKPIVSLSDIVKRQREGDLTVRAREKQGSLELSELAHDFNLLMEHEEELNQNRSFAQRMQELTVKIEHAIRDASSTRQASEILCVELGTGIAVDRVLVSDYDAERIPTLSAQWHRPGLPPLGDLPDELIPHARAVAEELWQSSRHLVASDRLAPEVQLERSKAYYRYTDARADIVAPIGVGDQVMGMIYVFTTTEPRVWRDAEVDAVDRVAAFLAQFIVERTHRDQLIEHVEKLEQLNRQKDTFVATVSHELRTPLTSIIGYLEVLKDGYAGDLTEEQERMLDVMDRNAIRLLGLIQDLLALNKRESEAGKLEMATVSMSELIATACQDLSPLAESGAIKIECDAGPEGAVVEGDRGKLQSVVVNIVSNAIKFSHRGDVVTIGCTLDESSRRVLLSCQDHGIGIPVADQGELFTRFYRASNAMSKFIPGTGLGLTIVKQIVDDHGGEIRLTSVEGEGTTVVIDLPLSPQGLV